jgi:hypothetical protein
MLVPALALGLSGCRRADSCARLEQQICQGGGVSCRAVGRWLDDELVGLHGDRLTGEPRARVCAAILAEKDVLSGFREKARAELTRKP